MGKIRTGLREEIEKVGRRLDNLIEEVMKMLSIMKKRSEEKRKEE